VKRRDLEAHLRRHGCDVLREGSNHTLVVNTATGDRSVVPRHTEIKPDLVRKICKDLGIPAPF
jgi:predicted RNA binding protein YcfA (HicA-like mRNA interferase family)